MAAAFETRSLIVPSNRPFEQWNNILPDAATALWISMKTSTRCRPNDGSTD